MVELSKKGVEADLPQGAHSVFRFDIKETSDDLLKEMETPSKKHYPDRRIIDRDGVQFEKGAPKAKWETQYADDGSMFLVDLDFDCEAEVKKTDEGLDITTAWGGYKYNIKDKSDRKGAEVEFHGPLNALLNQNILPTMTYVPQTLEGKFVDAETQEDLTPFMDINSYGAMRKKKNGKTSESENWQDRYGAQINKKFNNEIDVLPEWLPKQELKNRQGQEEYGKPQKSSLSGLHKERIQERIDELKGKVSGVVKADEKAEKAIQQQQPGRIIQADRSR